MSPGETAPSPSASVNRVAVFWTASRGAAAIAVTVGSAVPPTAGSSVDTAGSSALATVPWLLTWRTPAGSGESTLTRRVTVAAVPAASSPRVTRGGLAAATVPAVVATDPATRVVCAGSGSVSSTAVAAVLPVLRTVTV